MDRTITLHLTPKEASNLATAIEYQLDNLYLAESGEAGWTRSDKRGLERIQRELDKHTSATVP
jgi:hypothetical protein